MKINSLDGFEISVRPNFIIQKGQGLLLLNPEDYEAMKKGQEAAKPVEVERAEYLKGFYDPRPGTRICVNCGKHQLDHKEEDGSCLVDQKYFSPGEFVVNSCINCGHGIDEHEDDNACPKN